MNLDNVKERALENKELFKSQPESLNSELHLKNEEQEKFVGRKR